MECEYKEECKSEICVVNGIDLFLRPHNTNNPKSLSEIIIEHKLNPEMFKKTVGMKW